MPMTFLIYGMIPEINPEQLKDLNSISIPSYDSLLLLGFSKYGAKSLVNYVSKGGIIYSREKFKEIYGIYPKLVDELDDFISYPTKNTTKYTNSNDPEKPIIRASDKVIKIIELNSADSIELVGIKGIGRITAYKIIQMRMLL